MNHNDQFTSPQGPVMQADEWRTAFAWQARAGVILNHMLEFGLTLKF